MKSPFGEVFLFLTDLAWKSRITIPVLVTTAFLIMDIRLQIEINIQTGQVAAADLEDYEDSDTDDDDDDEDDDDDDDDNDGRHATSESSSDEDENGNLYGNNGNEAPGISPNISNAGHNVGSGHCFGSSFV